MTTKDLRMRKVWLEGYQIRVENDPDRVLGAFLEGALSSSINVGESEITGASRGFHWDTVASAIPVLHSPQDWPDAKCVPEFAAFTEPWLVTNDEPGRGGSLWIDGPELRALLREARRLRNLAGRRSGAAP